MFASTVPTTPAESDQESCPSLVRVTPIKEFQSPRLLDCLAHSRVGNTASWAWQMPASLERRLGLGLFPSGEPWPGVDAALQGSLPPNMPPRGSPGTTRHSPEARGSPAPKGTLTEPTTTKPAGTRPLTHAAAGRSLGAVYARCADWHHSCPRGTNHFPQRNSRPSTRSSNAPTLQDPQILGLSEGELPASSGLTR